MYFVIVYRIAKRTVRKKIYITVNVSLHLFKVYYIVVQQLLNRKNIYDML